MPRISSHVLDTGDRLYLRTAGDGDPHCVVVAQVRHGLIWVGGCDQPGPAGERVTMELRVPGDALYRAAARIEFVPPESWALRRIGEWERVQRRDVVRVATRGIQVEVAPDWDGKPVASLALADLSCGGACALASDETVEALPPGSEVVCRFALPGADSYAIQARVVRSEPARAPSGEARLAFRFLALDSDVESELLRWVLREHARRVQ